MGVGVTKKELRAIYQGKRKGLSEAEVFLYSEQIFERFVSFFNPQQGDKIHIFLSIEKFKEINTLPFIQFCFREKIRVFIPKIMGENLISIEITSQTKFEINDWGISEPVENIDSGMLDYDFVITPLLYCDCYGNRVGYGKGFYDVFFKSISEKVKKIGVNYYNPDEKIDDVWENDIPLDYLITPTDVLSFLGLK